MSGPLGLTPRAAIASGRYWAWRLFEPGANGRRLARQRLRRLFWRLQSRENRHLFTRAFAWQWRLMESVLRSPADVKE